METVRKWNAPTNIAYLGYDRAFWVRDTTLVTMRWWNGIWLNEAFATFMEIAACDAYRPDWERWTSFGLERSVAFDVGSTATRYSYRIGMSIHRSRMQ